MRKKVMMIKKREKRGEENKFGLKSEGDSAVVLCLSR